MGTLTLAEIKTEVRAGLGNRTDLDDRLTRLVNLAQIRMARTHHFDEMGVKSSITFPNTSDPEADKILSLSSITPAVWRIWSLRLTHQGSTILSNARRLVYVRPREWDDKIPAPEYYSVNKPRLYTRFGGVESNELEIWPSPDITYTGTLRYGKQPTYLVNDGDTSDFDEKDDLLITLTLVLAKDSLGMQDEAKSMFQQYLFMYNEGSVADDAQPDEAIIPSFEALGRSAYVGDYWKEPFIREAP